MAQLCLTLCDPIDCSPPGFSVHRILRARILAWIATPFSRGSSWPRHWTLVSCIAGRFIAEWPGKPHFNWSQTEKGKYQYMCDLSEFFLVREPWGPISSCRSKTKADGSITFRGVAIEFFQHEWEFLNHVPKKVYHNMLMENYSDLVSLGHSISRPDIIVLLKEGKEPWMVVRGKNKKLEYRFWFNL